jgi:glyoxalase family protein
MVEAPMSSSLPGIHHVTAITDEAQRNVEFYAGTLGLRLVKRTVNFDMPDTYHLYYGDDVGRPGTAMTFFVWPHLPRGSGGAGQVTTTAFAIPAGSGAWWLERLGDEWDAREATRFGAPAVALRDPDGIELELVEAGGDDRQPWTGSDVPAEHAVRGFHGVTLSLRDPGPTAALLTTVMGFHADAADDGRIRFRAGAGGPGSVVDLLTEARPGVEAAGTVHHVAFRTPDDERQAAWRQELVGRGISVTPVMDRCYFHSIYYREPGGVLFEIATDGPGFTVDEPVESLGTSLRLPPWLESRRAGLESVLAPITAP